MKQPSLRELAVMTIDEGEEIAGAWITPHIPGETSVRSANE